MSEFSIGQSSIIRLSKDELLKLINDTFTEDYTGCICTVTTLKNSGETIGQSITFGKALNV